MRKDVSMSSYQKGTECIHAGYTPGNGEPRNIPIIQSTTFRYESSAQMGALFDLEATGYFYTRLQNPTNDHVAAKIAALEGGTAAVLTSSGQAASFFAIFNICSAGDHVVASSAIYGGTYNLFAVTMKRMGLSFTFVDPECTEEELSKAFRPETRAVFGETIANPALVVLDIEKFASAAHEHGVPLIIDNTFATPINCRPFEWGADIVIHSTTKYMDGHANCVGGAIVDSGKFDWNKYPDKFPGLTTPDESYHGVTYTERFGLEGAYITKAVVQLMRDLGSIPAPMNSYLLNVGLETLHLRVPRHCRNARTVAEFVKNHPKVAWVNYPGLPEDKCYDLANKYLPNGTCGVVTFGIKGGRDAAETFMAELGLASIATHVADAKTCVLHPASATHRQMNETELAAAGVSPDLIRFSVGIEDAADIIADIAQALEHV
jgi:O-acetylhomoserine (thiol)-lyase